jgi:hypothetical protein
MNTKEAAKFLGVSPSWIRKTIEPVEKGRRGHSALYRTEDIKMYEGKVQGRPRKATTEVEVSPSTEVREYVPKRGLRAKKKEEEIPEDLQAAFTALDDAIEQIKAGVAALYPKIRDQVMLDIIDKLTKAK